MKTGLLRIGSAFGAALILNLLGGAPAPGQIEPAPVIPPSLKTIPVPEPPELASYVKDKQAAIRLGKALFWDMQVGSDNQACASCHFHAGADDRSVGQIDPGLRSVPADDTYQLGGPNFQLQPSHYPFRKLADPANRLSQVLFDTNDVTSSQGVFHEQFQHINFAGARDAGTVLPDPDFSVGGVNVRRVEPRNTPSVINAVFNVHNFWDGRASFYFNGNNPFGPLDTSSGILVSINGVLQNRIIRISRSSLASQAVGPATSDMEMSFAGRSWPDIGKKLLPLVPLGMQVVHPADSVLGPLSRAQRVGTQLQGTGLATDYASMIKAAFWDEYWDSKQIVRFVNGAPVVLPSKGRLRSDQYTQMQANFAFFFGLAVQTYEATLVSDDTPFDRFVENPLANPLTLQQQLGLGVFLSAGKTPFEKQQGACANCHTGAEFTNASLSFRQDPTNRIEIMPMASGTSFYDGGWYNTAVRPDSDDVGRDATSPFINPLTNAPYPLSYSKLGMLDRDFLLPPEVSVWVAPMPPGSFQGDPTPAAVLGAFKTPSLRNVELTGPYFHNGGQATLRQVIDFYDRGGDFHEANIADLHPDIADLFLSNDEKVQLVAFLLTLTDARVKEERAPFDHPQLFIANGSRQSGSTIVGNFDLIRPNGFRDTENVREIPAVGAGGLPAEGLPPIGTFLNLDPFLADTSH